MAHINLQPVPSYFVLLDLLEQALQYVPTTLGQRILKVIEEADGARAETLKRKLTA